MDAIDMRKFTAENDGYNWILNIVDVYSKFMFAFALKTKSAEEVRNCLRSLIMSEGAMAILQTDDNSREFRNNKIAELCDEFHIRYVYGRPRHPQNQGQAERANQTLVRALAKALFGESKRCWVPCLPRIVFEYNTCWHRAINCTPMELFKGRTGLNVVAVTDCLENVPSGDSSEYETPVAESESEPASNAESVLEKNLMLLPDDDRQLSSSIPQIAPEYLDLVEQFRARTAQCAMQYTV